MSQQDRSPRAPEERSPGDPWHAFGSIVSGVALYGFLGWLGDRLLGTEFLVAVGILFGAVLGLYATFRRFAASLPPEPPDQRPRQHPQQHPDE